MGRWTWPVIAGGAWLGLSLGLAMAGLWMRFERPYYLESQLGMQVMMVGECVLALVGLVCSMPLILWTAETSVGPKLVVVVIATPVVAAFVLQAAAFESPDENREKNVQYLKGHAQVILDYERRRGRMPASFDIAMEKSGRRFPHRGDADGNEVKFRRLDRHRYLICAPAARLHLKVEGGEVKEEPWVEGRGDPCYSGGAGGRVTRS